MALMKNAAAVHQISNIKYKIHILNDFTRISKARVWGLGLDLGDVLAAPCYYLLSHTALM